MHRREVLTLAGGGLVTTSLLAGCAAVGSNRQPTYSYEAIMGTWHGETPPGRRLHEWATVTFTSSRGAVGEEVGTVTLLEERGGDVLCRSSLTVRFSDSPTYWVDVEGGSFPCGTHRRYRFRYEPHEDREFGSRVLWFLTHDDEDIYHRVGSLAREDG